MQVEQANHINQAFSFRTPRTTDNKLVNKQIPGVTVEEPAHIVSCSDSETQPNVPSLEKQIVRTENPLQSDTCLAYFEVEVLAVAPEDTLSIGLTAKDNITKQHLGRTNNSFGYSKGELHLNKKKVGAITPPQKLKQGDSLGIGLNCHKKTLFLVKNGKVVIDKIPVPTNWSEYYPAVGVMSSNQKVKLIFNPKEFKFDYLHLFKTIEKEVSEEISKDKISSSKIYPLVHEYLQFHGYAKTLAMLTERQKDYHKLPKYCRHPGIAHPQIDLISKQSQQIIGEDEDMNQPLKGRHRIMSEIIEKEEERNLEMEIKRKNTEMIDENIRKNSVFSNLSNASNYQKSQGNNNGEEFYKEEEQKQMENQLNQNEQFLLTEKPEIVKLIKEKKIEEAMQIIERKIPELFAKEEIKALMKGHIFLRIAKEQSSLAALMYSHKEKECFSKYTGILFPFYSSEKLGFEWKAFKNIFSALAYNIKKDAQEKYADLVSDRQFQCFSDYINNLILKKMGYLGVSRLGFCVNNAKKVLEKLQNYKGMTCGVQLKM